MLPVDNNAHSRQHSGTSPAGSSSCLNTASQVASQQPSKDEIYEIWNEWAKNALPGRDELRDIAVVRLRDCLVNNTNTLDLAGLNLSSLPDRLPQHITELDVHNNELTKLPDNLPNTLLRISAFKNEITEIPGILPSSLVDLRLDFNKIEAIPENLPDSLVAFTISDNKLTFCPSHWPPELKILALENNDLVTIPNNLPNSLEFLRLNNNRLTSLPDHLPSSLSILNLSYNQFFLLLNGQFHAPNLNNVFLDDHRYSAQLIRYLIEWIRTNLEQELQILFSRSNQSPQLPAMPLIDSVRQWLVALMPESTVGVWKAIGQEEGAAAFSRFLNRLAETRNALENPAFKVKVSAWLERLAETPELRQTSFAVSLEATASCEDRVALAWNDMQKAVLLHEVQTGAWDNRLAKLLETGCEMFRLEQLEQVARDKFKTLQHTEELEVYLAYQTGLKDELELTSAGDLMRFASISEVKQEDLDQALTKITERERQEFHLWLAQWSPWKMALQRANPELIDKMQEQSSVITDSFPQRLETALQSSGLSGIEEAGITIGKQIWDEMLRENDIALTRTFLKNHYQNLLTDKPPKQTLEAVRELAAVAKVAPVVAAMVIRPENAGEEHPSSLIASGVAGGKMTPIAQIWLSLLTVLYRDQCLSKAEIISSLLPNSAQDSIKSLAHAVAGAAWNSEAATKLSALLCDISASDEKTRQEILARLGLEQHGYGFKQPNLQQSADFFQRAEQADRLSANEDAKALLRKGNLIPKNRELYRMASTEQLSA